MKELFLKYPSVEDTNNITSVSHLSDELSFGAYALPDPLPNSNSLETYVSLEVLSLCSLFGRSCPDWSDYYRTEETKSLNNSDSTKQSRFLNVSAYLTLTGESYGHISLLFLEGLYDPLDGKIFFVGCRDAPVFNESIINNPSLESRMDCLIEVKVEYSSKTIRWLINPTAKVYITSQRNEEDPLYFRSIFLKTDLIPYRNNSKEIKIRRNFEAVLQILVLIASTACILSQLLYIQKKADVILFVSLTMFGIQALCFGLPLFTGTAILFKWKEFEDPMSHRHPKETMWFQVLGFIMRSVLLVAFVLSLRLFQKIRKARVRLPANRPQNRNQHPGDKPVFLSSWTMHMVGFLGLLIIHNKKSEDGVRTRSYYKPPEWLTDLGEYMGVVQDLFLLPQIIGNIIWQTQVKPLTEVYYIGFTGLRLLIRAYDYVRDPVLPFYFDESKIKNCSEFLSKSADIVIIATLIVLAITVEIQQRWNSRHHSS